MCGGLRLLAHNLGLGTGTSGSLAPALAPPQLILTAGTLPGPCFCCYKCSPISLQRRPGRQPVARRCGEELVAVEAQCPVSTVVSSLITTVRHQPGPGQGLVTQHPASPPPRQGPYTTVVTTLTGMGVKYCVETESFILTLHSCFGSIKLNFTKISTLKSKQLCRN